MDNNQYVKCKVRGLQSLLNHLYKNNTTDTLAGTTQFSYKTPDFQYSIGKVGGFRSIDAIFKILQTNIPGYDKKKFKKQYLNLKNFNLQICTDIENLTFYKANDDVYPLSKLRRDARLSPALEFALHKLDKYNL